MKDSDFYNITKLAETGADYLVGIGERSNGKSFQVKNVGLFGLHTPKININGYLDDGTQFAVIRRWDDDIKGDKGADVWNDFINNKYRGNILKKETKGRWNSIHYLKRRWYLQRINDKGEIEERDETPFAYAFALSTEEHVKSLSYPNIKNIFFDEFITRGYYLPDEFVKFTSLLSTIIRLDDGVRIYMMANTVSKNCPYFNEMGLKRIKDMQQGTIDVYSYGDSLLKVAVEFTNFPAKHKASNKYFAFNNPKLSMIIGQGNIWEIALYPHLPCKYSRTDVAYEYYIVWDGDIYHCEIIQKESNIFTYIHRKTTPIKEDTESLVYQQEHDMRMNYVRKINKPRTKLQKRIAEFFVKEKVFYQDNEVGEAIRSYIMWCKSDTV